MDIPINSYKKNISSINTLLEEDCSNKPIIDEKVSSEQKIKFNSNGLAHKNYLKNGWHLKNHKLKEKMSCRSGNIPCYICDKRKTFDEISYCRILSYNQMPFLNQLETFDFKNNNNLENNNANLCTKNNSIIKQNISNYNITESEKQYLKEVKEEHLNCEQTKISDKTIANYSKKCKNSNTSSNDISNDNSNDNSNNNNNSNSNGNIKYSINSNKKNSHFDNENKLWDDNYYFKRAENVYVICSDCASQELIVRAPKNYKMVQEHYFNKNIEYMTFKNIQHELLFKKRSLLFQRKLLDDDITDLKEKVKVLSSESKKIHKNVEIEEKKFQMLNSLKKKNETTMNFLNENQKQFSNSFNELMNQCSHLLSKTNESFWNMNKNILNANRETNSQVNMNIASLESLCDTQEVSHPCSLCYSSDIDTAINPCGHTFCSKCIDKLSEKKCPHCNLSFNSVLKIYL